MRRLLVALALCLCTTPFVRAQERETVLIDAGLAHESAVESIEVAWRMRLEEGDAGAGVALLNATRYGDALPALDDWTEPNLPDALAIGFDTYNPPPTAESRQPRGERAPMSWFNERGNYYDRPQREVSVHEGGVERLNIRSPVELTTGDWVEARLRVRYEPGAAFVSLTLDGQSVLNDEILPGVTPSAHRVCFGGPEGAIDGSSIEVHTGVVTDGFAQPVRVMVFDERFLHAGDQRPKSVVDFSAVPEGVARVVATLTLDEPEVGLDHWDKKGRIGLTTDDGEVEVLRFITPFRRAWTWRADVTDLFPLFTEEREMCAWIETYMKGWSLSFTLDFYTGEAKEQPICVVTLWDGTPEIGNPENPPSAFFETRTINVPDGATHAYVRTTATGHGMAPNSNNAGEFMPLGRTLTVSSKRGSTSQYDLLWKTDVYLNPCRPQGGTWKFDRAGWSPGDLVLPWRVDVSHLVEPGETLTIAYELDDYLNEGRGETWAPHHWTTVQVVFTGPQSAR